MPAQQVRCPGCGAGDDSPPDLKGIHTCRYCGARYRLDASHAAVPVATGTDGASVVVVVLVAMVVLAFVGGIAAIAAGMIYFTAISDHAEVASSPEATTLAEEVDPPVAVAVAEPAPAPAPAPAKAGSPAPQAEADVGPATAEFEFHSVASGHKESFYVLGYVTNTSKFVIDKPKVVVVLLDAQGNEVGTDVGFAVHDDLEPGQRSPVKVLVKDPPPHKERVFEVKPRRSTFSMGTVEGLRVEAKKPAPRSLGRALEVEGKVFHDGTKPAKFVRVEIEAFDADEKLVGLYSSYADDRVVQPGESTRFRSMGMLFDEPPARFEFSVFARPAK